MQKTKKDVGNFDTDFTNEKPVLTPSDREAIEAIDQNEFAGFSFVSCLDCSHAVIS